LTGTVYDEKTKQPIPNVNIYFDGTSIHTITDKNGEFRLVVKDFINTILVFSHVSYNDIFIQNPFYTSISEIFMTEKIVELEEFSVIGDPFTRKEKLEAFRRLFLGTTEAGKSCKILNEDDIRLYYNPHTRTLSADSDQPIRVENSYLSYQLRFGLVDFKSVFNDITLKIQDMTLLHILGTTSFTDTAETTKKIKKRRDKHYLQSSNSFFKHLVNQTLKDSKFRLFYGGFPVDPYQHFTVKDTLSMKLVKIKPIDMTPEVRIRPFPDLFSDNSSEAPRTNNGFVAQISVLYDKTIQSTIHFNKDSFLVDHLGNYNPADRALLFSGHWGDQRVGDMLPINYEYVSGKAPKTNSFWKKYNYNTLEQ